jgi:hypothetical protein
VPYTSEQARQQLLDAIVQAADRLGGALASLSEAYEQLDEGSADAVEEQVFRPVQAAYGRAKRTHDTFATRHGLPPGTFAAATPVAPSRGVQGFVQDALDGIGEADRLLAELQDSMLPVEVGDVELRADLEHVRAQLDGAATHARQLARTFGR